VIELKWWTGDDSLIRNHSNKREAGNWNKGKQVVETKTGSLWQLLFSHNCEFISHNSDFSFNCVYIAQFWLCSRNWVYLSPLWLFFLQLFISHHYNFFLAIVNLYLTFTTFFTQMWVNISQFWFFFSQLWVYISPLLFSGNCEFISHHSDFFQAIVSLYLTITTFFSQLYLYLTITPCVSCRVLSYMAVHLVLLNLYSVPWFPGLCYGFVVFIFIIKHFCIWIQLSLCFWVHPM